jgi:hypothetical protein
MALSGARAQPIFTLPLAAQATHLYPEMAYSGGKGAAHLTLPPAAQASQLTAT